MLETLPIVRTTRRAQWQYLDFGVELEDIARQIGDQHQTVQRLYRALLVIEQAERVNVFKRENRYKKQFSFSHLYTGLDYEGIAGFVRLKDESAESESPVAEGRMEELGDLCRWLYGDKRDDEPPVVQSQNPDLRNLDAVLRSPKAVDALRSGLPLSVALEVSMGDERVFRNALAQAKEALQKARATLSTGFSGEHDLLTTAQSIFTLAQDLLDEMQRKSARPKSPASRK
ncbi:MAG: hypothetical protein HYZ53_12375 [Planctomycetes bacterium]|nr:hypothetical protein [Planctomycetota bacterium]